MNVRTLCLGILTFQEASGYEIKKMVEEDAFSHFIDASYGSIYPALTKMLEDDLVSVRTEEQAGKPDKKVYAITKAGKNELTRALAIDPAKDKFKSEFMFQILLQEYLSPQHVADIYDGYLQYLGDELEKMDAAIHRCADSSGHAPPSMSVVAGYGRACMLAGVKYLEENREKILNPGKPDLKIVTKQDK